MHKNVHLQLRFAELDAVVREGNLEELVLPNKYNVVILCWVKLVRGVCWFGGIPRGMEPVQRMSNEVRVDTWMAQAYNHL